VPVLLECDSEASSESLEQSHTKQWEQNGNKVSTARNMERKMNVVNRGGTAQDRLQKHKGTMYLTMATILGQGRTQLGTCEHSVFLGTCTASEL
jgi:hypothetical protein